MIAVNDLGSVGVGGVPTDDLIGSPAQRLLLMALAVEQPTPVSDDRLTELLWPGEAPSRRRLWDNVHRLRRALEAGGTGIEVARVGDGYTLAQPVSLDSRRFEELVGRAEGVLSTAPLDAIELVGEALRLWRGPPFLGFDLEGFAPGLVGRLNACRRRAVVALARARLAIGDAGIATVELEDLIAEHPFDEDLIILLVTALNRSGRTVEALRRLRGFREDLAEQLGLDPGPALADLEAELLSSSDGESIHPPLGSVADLPRWRTSLIGRQGASERLRALIGENRLVSLVGPAGVGKTRLATETLRETDVAGGGVRFIDLAVTSDPSAVDSVVAGSLGIRDASPRVALVHLLQRSRCTVIFDNCEHLPEAVADLVDHLLERTGGTRVLATTREPLRVGGEVVFRLDPLDIQADTGPSSAARLFCERAGLQPNCLSPEDVRLVEEIARRLDGLPLAIELAAARTSSMSLADLVSDLDDRYDLLTRGERSGPSRHRTLQAAVDWSYDLLGPDRQAVLTRCSTFAGPFTLDDAASVCSDRSFVPSRVRSAVADLVDASLITRADGQLPYRLLETLREYGRNELDAVGERAIWARHHGGYFAERAGQLAEQSYGPSELAAIDELLAQSDEYRTAIHTLRAEKAWEPYAELIWSLATAAFHLRGTWLEPVYLAVDLALQPPDPAPPRWAALPAMVAALFYNRGLLDAAEEHATLAIRLDPGWFRSWWSGVCAAAPRDPALALERAEMAVSLSDPDVPDEWLCSLDILSFAKRLAGDRQGAVDIGHRVVAESRRFDSHRGESAGWLLTARALPAGAPGAAQAARKAFEFGRSSRTRTTELNGAMSHVRHLLADDLDGTAEALAEYLRLPIIYSPPGFRVLGAATAYFAVAGDVDFARRLGNLLGRNNFEVFAGYPAVDALLDQVPAHVDPLAISATELEVTTALVLERILG